MKQNGHDRFTETKIFCYESLGLDFSATSGQFSSVSRVFAPGIDFVPVRVIS